MWFETRPNAASLFEKLDSQRVGKEENLCQKKSLEKTKRLVKTALVWLCSNFSCWQRSQLKKVLLGFAGLSLFSQHCPLLLRAAERLVAPWSFSSPQLPSSGAVFSVTAL